MNISCESVKAIMAVMAVMATIRALITAIFAIVAILAIARTSGRNGGEAPMRSPLFGPRALIAARRGAPDIDSGGRPLKSRSYWRIPAAFEIAKKSHLFYYQGLKRRQKRSVRNLPASPACLGPSPLGPRRAS